MRKRPGRSSKHGGISENGSEFRELVPCSETSVATCIESLWDVLGQRIFVRLALKVADKVAIGSVRAPQYGSTIEHDELAL